MVAEGVVEDISHEGLRALLREEGVSFQRLKTFKHSNDLDFEPKQARVLELYAIADGHAKPGPEDPAVVICLDQFGPLNLKPHARRQWGATRGLPRVATPASARDLQAPARGAPSAGRL